MNNKQALQKRVQMLKDNLSDKYPTDDDKERFKYSREYARDNGKYLVALKELERVGEVYHREKEVDYGKV